MITSFEKFLNEDYSFGFYLDEIESEYFSPYHKIKLDPNLEGYKIIDGIAHVGSRIAYKKNSVESLKDGLFHEMGHIVMIENFDRLKMYAFGLEYTTKDSLGYSIPTSWNAIKNEIRAIVWQSIICKKYHIPFDAEKFVSALKYMEDFINVPLKGCFYQKANYKWYYDENFEREVSYEKKDTFRLETIVDFLKEESKRQKYSIEEFNKRWHQRCQWLERHL